MAQSTLPVFSHPDFSQVLGAAIDEQIRRVDTFFAEAALDRIRQARLLDAELCMRGEAKAHGA
jgi:hypothetical protein